jgi:threonine/homoserine/homoserine lactone efflux protein
MELNLLLRGLILGISIAAPVGPIGVLCIRRTISDGHLIGLVSGLGAATADAVYGVVAGLGLTLITNMLVQQQMRLRLFGGLFLCYLGVKTLLSQPIILDGNDRKHRWSGAYLSTFILTLTNPMTLISFTAIFASTGVGTVVGDYGKAITLILGVFTGSAIWWLLLSSVVGVVRTKIEIGNLTWVNRISGGIITAFGVATIMQMGR